MDNTQNNYPPVTLPSPQTPPTQTTSPQKAVVSKGPVHKKTRIFFTSLLVLILIAGGSAGGYWYGNKTKKTATPSVNAATQSKSAATSQSSQSVHFVQSIGYPFDQAASKYQFATKLGVPSTMQAVKISSTSQNFGVMEVFTNDVFNNELGRWELGNPGDDGDNSGGVSELSLIAITNSWLNATGKTDFTDMGYGSAMETPAQKQQFINQLVSSTASCVKDTNKGFKTADGNLDVCYNYSYGKEAYSPSISFSGYGDIQSQPLILVGQINIYDTSVGSDQTAEVKAVSDANAGHPTATTAQAQKAIIAALKQTTVTASLNAATN